MRNISFDESTVLKELAEIARKNGLIKEANPLVAEMNRLNDYWANIYSRPNAKNMFAQELAKTVNMLSQKFPGNEQAIMGFKNEAEKIPQPIKGTASDETAAKTAEEKKYDVTGETGENLIDKAHPGGGTKTELDSKTDENLVETIVEQQEKDLEVARKIPKGVLAKLIEIANSLDKKGYYDEANEVDAIINKLAAPTAQMIQNEFNRVNVAAGDKFLDVVINNLPSGAAGGGARTVLEGLRGKGFLTARTEAARLLNTQSWGKGPLNAGMSAVSNEVGQLGTFKQQLMSLQQQPGGDGVPDAVQKPEEPERGVAYKAKKKNPKLEEWQGEFNKAIMGVPAEKLKELGLPWTEIATDGIPGPQTAKAWALVKKYGDMYKFDKAMEELRGAVSPTEEKTEPQKTEEKTDFYEKFVAPYIFPRIVSMLGKKSYKELSSKGVGRLSTYIKRTIESIRNEAPDANDTYIANAVLKSISDEINSNLDSYKTYFGA